MSAPHRPALRYHGGKWKLAPWVLAHFPAHHVYVESFGGGASVLLRKPRAYAEVYNDLDGELVAFFRVLRDEHGSRRLAELLHCTPFARSEFELSYEPSADPVEQARRTVVRSFMGFGSNAHNQPTGFRASSNRFRASSNRSGSPPARDWQNYPANIPLLCERLRGVVIEQRDAAAVMLAADGPTTLHYVDPPYVASTRGPGKDYAHEMSDEDHHRLAGVLRELTGMVVLSGYACELYDGLYHDWTRAERAARADGARERTEVLWLNPACAFALSRGQQTMALG